MLLRTISGRATKKLNFLLSRNETQKRLFDTIMLLCTSHDKRFSHVLMKSHSHCDDKMMLLRTISGRATKKLNFLSSRHETQKRLFDTKTLLCTSYDKRFSKHDDNLVINLNKSIYLWCEIII